MRPMMQGESLQIIRVSSRVHLQLKGHVIAVSLGRRMSSLSCVFIISHMNAVLKTAAYNRD